MLASFEEICHAMKNRTPITITGMWGDTVSGVVNSIEATDGSGRCWNVVISHNTSDKVPRCGLSVTKVYVRTL
jgi:hypothetical protein